MEQVKITQIKSSIGRLPNHIKTANALGLGRIGKTKVHKRNPSVDGMIKQIEYMLKVEKA
ncbi:MAG: 50S ribosomal protein L30 [Leptospiraceae bacterium]|nr:50S ribosomal protein L30 [Leptospiraceae bacterium]